MLPLINLAHYQRNVLLRDHNRIFPDVSMRFHQLHGACMLFFVNALFKVDVQFSCQGG